MKDGVRIAELFPRVPARSRSLPGPASPQNRERLSIMKDTYAILIYWSDDDEALIATVPELPGCMAHSETRALAIDRSAIRVRDRSRDTKT